MGIKIMAGAMALALTVELVLMFLLRRNWLRERIEFLDAKFGPSKKNAEAVDRFWHEHWPWMAGMVVIAWVVFVAACKGML